MTDITPATYTPEATMMCSAFHFIKAVVSPADGLTGLWGLTVKAHCLSTCLPPTHQQALALFQSSF